MHLFICKRSKGILYLPGILLLLGFPQAVWAAGPPSPSIFSNTLAVTLITLMLLLLIIIGILGNILIGTADYKNKKNQADHFISKNHHFYFTDHIHVSSPIFICTGCRNFCYNTGNSQYNRRHVGFHLLYYGFCYFPGTARDHGSSDEY